MAFDLSTAKPVDSSQRQETQGFDLSTAKPVASLDKFKTVPRDEHGAGVIKKQGTLTPFEQVGSAVASVTEKAMMDPNKAISSLSDIITGADRRTEATEKLGRFSDLSWDELKTYFKTDNMGALKKNFQLAYMMFTTQSDEERKKILTSIDDRIGFETDKLGNDFVVYPSGDKRVLNPPGADFSDALTMAAETAKFVPAAKIAGAVQKTAKTLAKTKAAITAGAGAGLTSYASEKAQEAQGADFDKAGVVLETIASSGFEFASPLFTRLWQKMNPSVRRKAIAAETLDDLNDIGLLPNEVQTIADEIKKTRASSEIYGLRQPTPAQITAGSGATGGQKLMGQLDVAAGSREEYARKVLREGELQEQAAGEALTRVFGPSGDTQQLKAIGGAVETAQEVIGQNKLWRSKIADFEYGKAFEGVPDIDTRNIQSEIQSMIDSDAAQGLALEKTLKRIKRALKPRTPDEPPTLFDQFNREIKVDVPEELSPRVLQQINWELRDMLKIKNDKSITSSVKRSAAILSGHITDILNKSTKGQYSRADDNFRFMSDALEKLTGGKIGKTAARDEEQYMMVLRDVFNPAPSNRALAKDFAKRLEQVQPGSFDALYRNYFASTIENLPQGAKASDYLKAIYGKGEDSVNMIMDLAGTGPVGAQRRKALSAIRDGLEMAELLEKTPTPRQAAIIQAQMDEGQGIRSAITRWVRPQKVIEQSGLRATQKHQAKVFFEMATDEKWLPEFIKLVDSRWSRKSSGKLADLISKVSYNIKRRGRAEAAFQASPAAMIDTDSLNNETDSE